MIGDFKIDDGAQGAMLPDEGACIEANFCGPEEGGDPWKGKRVEQPADYEIPVATGRESDMFGGLLEGVLKWWRSK